MQNLKLFTDKNTFRNEINNIKNIFVLYGMRLLDAQDFGRSLDIEWKTLRNYTDSFGSIVDKATIIPADTYCFINTECYLGKTSYPLIIELIKSGKNVNILWNENPTFMDELFLSFKQEVEDLAVL